MRRIDSPQAIPAPHTLGNPLVLAELIELLQSPDLDYSEFCCIAEREPVISSRILRAARTILTGFDSRVESLPHAIALIGLSRVQGVLSALGRELRVTSDVVRSTD